MLSQETVLPSDSWESQVRYESGRKIGTELFEPRPGVDAIAHVMPECTALTSIR
jgi:hypothetical protein